MIQNDSFHLTGIVTISKRNTKTGEIRQIHQGHNIISISGMQWILMKMFGLYLDAPHAVPYEKLNKDTNLVIPELDQSSSIGIGVKPENYTTMVEPISDKHFIQGFMIGNGGAGEDQMTAKNTDYSFICLRNPIPFQQTNESLPAEIAGKYLGIYNKLNTNGFTKSYFIKKFDSTPHIYHSWWKDGQKWDYVDPVTENDLGPNAAAGAGKTDRIESYAECEISLSETDCVSYFENSGNNQTPAINELGLVAFDTTVDGDRSILEELYTTHIKTIIDIIFNNNRTEDDTTYLKSLVGEAYTVLTEIAVDKYDIEHTQTNLYEFYQQLESMNSVTPDQYDFPAIQDALGQASNIAVNAFYNQRGEYQYETDSYLACIADPAFDAAGTNEAQRIKLITYYTFKSIPLEENEEILINYRIYAN